MTERRFVQINNEWINLDNVTNIVDLPDDQVLKIYFGDTNNTIPVILRRNARESFLYFLEHKSYHAPVIESCDPSVKKAVPATVLIDICRAIMQDKYALTEAAKTMIPVHNDFIGAMDSIILYISEPEVRELASNELRGVRYDSDNKRR